MPDREKVIKGLECCLPSHDPDCDLCPYDSIDLRCRAKLRDDVMALLDIPARREAKGGNAVGMNIEYTSDRVNVVRCRDCKYSDTFYSTTTDTMPLKCLNIRYGGVMPDWYCEHGERREDE